MEVKKIRLGNILLSSNVLMAPLAGYTCYPFRMLAYEMGAGLCFTEMVSANALKYEDRATKRLLLTTKKEKIKAVQLLGGNPAVMERMACSELLKDFDVIDINMGCHVPNVFKSGEGSALMLDQMRASAIIRSCKKSGKVVTVKCRTGISEESMFTAEFAKMCEDSGADMLTIHGRSRNMMYNGTPYYEEIEQAKTAVSISLKNVVTTTKDVGAAAFAYCVTLEQVKLVGLKVLKQRTFEGCVQLKEFRCKEAEEVKQWCFCGCEALEYFDFQGISCLESYAFEGCNCLKQAEFQEGTYFMSHAFEDCGRLEEIILRGMVSFREYAFSGCTALRRIYFLGKNGSFLSIKIFSQRAFLS